MRRKNPEGTKLLTVRVPPELHRRLKVKAAEMGTTVADTVNRLIEQWLNDKAKKV